jgi:hypothetical protein
MNANQPVVSQPASAITSEPKPSSSCLGGLIKSFIISVIVVVVCAAAWGAVAYFTGKIYVWGAILIGVVVSMAAMSGFTKVNIGVALLMFIPSVALTLAAILLGDYIFYTLSAMREFGVDLSTALQGVAELFIELETSQDGKTSMLLGGIGALVGFYYAVRSGR